MTFEEFRKALMEGKAITTKEFLVYIKRKGDKLVAYWKSDGAFAYEYDDFKFSSKDLLNNELGYEIYNKPILDEVEKKYLSGVIGPFRKDYKIIVMKQIVDDDYENIDIEFRNKNDGVIEGMANLPCFKDNSMYKWMEALKEYTLEELGL